VGCNTAVLSQTVYSSNAYFLKSLSFIADEVILPFHDDTKMDLKKIYFVWNLIMLLSIG